MPAVSKTYISDIKQILREARTKAYAAISYSMVEAYWLIGKRIVEEVQQGEHRANYGEQVIKSISKALTAEFGRGFSERSIRQYRQFYQLFPKLSIQRSMIAISDKSAKSKTQKRDSAIMIAKSGKPAKSKIKGQDSAITIAKSSKPAKSKIKGQDPAIADRQISSQPSINWTHIQRIMRVSNSEARSWYLQEAVEQSWDVRTLDRNISTQYYERLLMSQVKKSVIREMRIIWKTVEKTRNQCG